MSYIATFNHISQTKLSACIKPANLSYYLIIIFSRSGAILREILNQN